MMGIIVTNIMPTFNDVKNAMEKTTLFIFPSYFMGMINLIKEKTFKSIMLKEIGGKYMHMFRYGYLNNWGWEIGMFLMMAFWLVVIVGVIYLIVKNISKDKSSSNKALEILDINLAQGEISEEEYLQKKRILKEK